MDVWCVCVFFCVCVVLCLRRGLATSWSPVQGVLPTVNDQETKKSVLCSKVGTKRKKKINESWLIMKGSQMLVHGYFVLSSTMSVLSVWLTFWLSRWKQYILLKFQQFYQTTRRKTSQDKILHN
jgi:hypothetical protein